MNGGIKPVVINEKLFASKKSVKAIQPEYIQYYYNVLDETRNWILANYDESCNCRANSDRFKEQLMQLRAAHYLELTRIAENVHDGGYYVINGASVHRPNDLGKYWLYKHGEDMKNLYFAGTYEYTLDYITEILAE